jgi:hypothetical protein
MGAMIQNGHFAKGIAGPAFCDKGSIDCDVHCSIEYDEYITAQLPFVEN